MIINYKQLDIDKIINNFANVKARKFYFYFKIYNIYLKAGSIILYC